MFVAVASGCSALRASIHSARSLQAVISTAYESGERQITVPPGTYQVTPPARGSHLQFKDMSNFTINARGVTLVLNDNTRGGIEFLNCDHVTLTGVTILYKVPPFTQGVISSIAPDGSFYDLEIEQGYPANLDDARYFPSQPSGYLFDPRTRWWKPGTYDLYGSHVQRLGKGKFRLFWNRSSGPTVHPAAVGDLMAFRGSGQHNLTILESSAMHMEGITIYNAGSFAVWERGGEGANHYTVTVKRGPRPAGALTFPLLSSTADAFHSVNVRHGPVVENSYIESMPDDGIAIHGTYSLVLQAAGKSLVINKNTFRPGDPYLLYDTSGRPAANGVVADVTPAPRFQNDRKSTRNTRSDNTAGPYFVLTLDRPVQAQFDYLLANPAAMGSGYILRNNTIRNHRARGMLLKAQSGLVEGNTIDGSTMGGIVLTPEFWWNEADFSRDIVIRHNIIRHVAYAPRQLGGVVVAALNGSLLVAAHGHQNILIEDNTFEDLNGVNLLITSAQHVVVRRNHFLRAQQIAVECAGKDWDEDAGALIFVTQSSGVVLGENSVSDLGNFNKRLVEATSTAQVEGAVAGVTLSQ